MSKTTRNEQRKLTATYLNGIAIGLVTVGVLAPIVALLTGAVTSALAAGLLAASCVLISATLHYGARLTLSGLED